MYNQKQIKAELVRLKQNFLPTKQIEITELENLVNKFNIFTSLNLAEREVKHSQFLAWLLNPNENHGLNASFLKKVIIKAYKLNSKKWSEKINNEYLSLLEQASFMDAHVSTEQDRIDILIHSEARNFVCAIENKIRADEHGEQLNKYKKVVETKYKGCTHLFIFLTPGGKPPSNENYFILGYKDISEIIQSIITLGIKNKEIELFINHYLALLKNYIIDNSEIDSLLKNIAPKKELEQIKNKYFNDLQDKLEKIIQEIVLNDGSFDKIKPSGKTMIRFLPKSLNPIFRSHTISRRHDNIMYFEFKGQINEGLKLYLVLLFRKEPNPKLLFLRKEVYRIAKENNEQFKEISDDHNEKSKCEENKETHVYIYQKDLLTKEEYQNLDIFNLDDLKIKLQIKFNEFKSTDLVNIVSLLKYNLE